MKIERQIKLDTEEKYKMANQFLFSYAFDNDLDGEVKIKEVSFSSDTKRLLIYSDFFSKKVTIRGGSLREINNLEQQLKRINKKLN